MVAARIAIAIAIAIALARRPSMTTSSRCRLLTAYYDQLTLCWCWWRITRIGGAGSSWCWWVRVIMIIMRIVKVKKHHPDILAFTFLRQRRCPMAVGGLMLMRSMITDRKHLKRLTVPMPLLLIEMAGEENDVGRQRDYHHRRKNKSFLSILLVVYIL